MTMCTYTENLTVPLQADAFAHFRNFGAFTDPGLYGDLLRELPDDPRDFGPLVRSSMIHRKTLAAQKTGTRSDPRFGDMNEIPWWRQPEDDNFPTAAAMLAELYRRDQRGFSTARSPAAHLILTCRFVAIVVASILKTKGLAARVRSGHAPYLEPHVSVDHWINQYWDDTQNRWITIDVDASFNRSLTFDPYDVPLSAFDFAADAWLNIRRNTVNPRRFHNAGGFHGPIAVAWSLFYDFHSLMNNECIYLHNPDIVSTTNFDSLTARQLNAIDELAELMLKPEHNFHELVRLYETRPEFRVLSGALL